MTALNLEAMTLMRRGAPPAGGNPFPLRMPTGARLAAPALARLLARCTPALRRGRLPGGRAAVSRGTHST